MTNPNSPFVEIWSFFNIFTELAANGGWSRSPMAPNTGVRAHYCSGALLATEQARQKVSGSMSDGDTCAKSVVEQVSASMGDCGTSATSVVEPASASMGDCDIRANLAALASSAITQKSRHGSMELLRLFAPFLHTHQDCLRLRLCLNFSWFVKSPPRTPLRSDRLIPPAHRWLLALSGF